MVLPKTEETKPKKPQPTKLKTTEDWDQYFIKDKALAEQVKKALFSYMDMNDIEFKNFVSDWSVEQQKIFLQKMRSEMLFYKNIINEDYYNKNPKGQRYQESLRKYDSINLKGKQLYQFIKSQTN